MNTKKYKKVLEREIDKLNQKIDLKILWGQSYREEARRHKALLERIYNKRKGSFFSRTLQYMSLF